MPILIYKCAKFIDSEHTCAGNESKLRQILVDFGSCFWALSYQHNSMWCINRLFRHPRLTSYHWNLCQHSQIVARTCLSNLRSSGLISARQPIRMFVLKSRLATNRSLVENDVISYFLAIQKVEMTTNDQGEIRPCRPNTSRRHYSSCRNC